MAKKKVIKKKKPQQEIISGSTDLYNSLTSIRFTLKGKVYEIDVGSELIVDGEDLHSQVERIPAVMGYFGSVVGLLKKEFKNKESLFKQVEAKIDRRIREAGITGEQRIDKAVKRHPKWLEAQMAINASREKYNRAQSLYGSLKEKSMVLLSRSADIRSVPSDSIMGVAREDIFPVSEED